MQRHHGRRARGRGMIHLRIRPQWPLKNVRLFTELQEKNRALTQAHAQVSEALEQQMATAEILRVISTSPTDIQPMLDAVVRSAARLCEGYDVWIGLTEGENLRVRAHQYAWGE